MVQTSVVIVDAIVIVRNVKPSVNRKHSRNINRKDKKIASFSYDYDALDSVYCFIARGVAGVGNRVDQSQNSSFWSFIIQTDFHKLPNLATL